ncbi:hypothetical protein H0N98_00640 [Candidatus Micrarchaeota archaeon]|nr:hypothetical protein [Candidatus Micrarchaeota archaeon]
MIKMRNNTKMLFILLLLGLSTPVFAATTTSMAAAIALGLCGFKTLVYGVLPTLALIMFLFAGLAYAAGQAFGAEMRAKAQGWAMSLLVGGIIGIFLAVLAPILVTIFVSMGLPSGSAC